MIIDQASPVEIIRGMRSINKASGVRLPPITKQPSRQSSGKTLERQYFREIMRILDPYYTEVHERLIPKLPDIVSQFKSETRVDAVKHDVTYGETITEAIGDIKIGIAIQITDSIVGGSALNQAVNVSDFNRNQFTRQFSSVLGVNPLLNESYLQAQVDAFTERNTALIKNIPDQSINRIETLIRTQVEQGRSTEFIRKAVQSELDISRNRAKLIARDQVNKFNGKLTELRQSEAGIEDYIWSTSRDERVRPTHASKQGKKFSWDNPPSDTGHPGNDIQCRCVAMPVLEDFKSAPNISTISRSGVPLVGATIAIESIAESLASVEI